MKRLLPILDKYIKKYDKHWNKKEGISLESFFCNHKGQAIMAKKIKALVEKFQKEDERGKS
jgi:protoporphyrinogen oxidase